MYEPQRQPSGCLEVVVLTRVIFGIMFWPLLALVLVLAVLFLIFYLFTIQPLLALIPVAAVLLLAAAFARWEQGRFRPPPDGPPEGQ